MSYPKSLRAFKDAAAEYTPNVAEAVDDYEAALEQVSGRNMAVQIFEALKGADGLDDEGRRILAGAAHLCGTLGWLKPPTEALEVFAAVFPTLPAEEPPQ